MKNLFILLALLPVLSNAQVSKQIDGVDSAGQGIYFEQGLNWQQVLAKAKAGNKCIFMDCYTSWCVPCKQMEKEVYPLQKVSDFFNNNFISVKMQIDTSKMDNDLVKASYADAHYIEKHYKIQGYPTFLFFSPDGNILNISVGAQGANEFIKLGTDALDPKRDYYKLLANYKQGKRDIAEMSYIASTGPKLGDTARSQEVAKAYILNLQKKDWFRKDNIEFMRQFTKSSKDIGFNLFYKYTGTINKVMSDDSYAEAFVSYIIYKEIVVPEMKRADKSNSSPDWNALTLIIRKKYGNYYAERVTIAAKINWEREHKNWPMYTKYYVLFNEKYNSLKGGISPDGVEDLVWNNRAWEVFKYSNKKDELIKALQWSNRAVMMNPLANWIDTYANILYKLGYENLAISWEELAAKQDPTNGDIQTDIEKMKKKEPTWPLQ